MDTLFRFLYECNFALQMLLCTFGFAEELSELKREKGLLWCWQGWIYILCGGSFLFISDWILASAHRHAIYPVTLMWHVLLLVGLYRIIRACFLVTNVQAVFLISCGYFSRQIIYTIFYMTEMIVADRWLGRNQVIMFLMEILPLLLFWKLLRYMLRRSKLKNLLDIENKMGVWLLYGSLTGIFLFQIESIMYMSNFYWDMIGIGLCIVEILTCVTMLILYFNSLNLFAARREVQLITTMLKSSERQYQHNKENIELINRKSHDLKHQIQAMRLMDQKEQKEAVDELEKAVFSYDAIVKTGNEVLDVLLSEKSLYCDHHDIRFSCIVDPKSMEFMSSGDLYGLLGNAIDNAIEAVEKLSERRKRTISITIMEKEHMVSLHIENYYEGEIRFEQGLPVTRKEDKMEHGFGTMSIAAIVKKYGGTYRFEAEEEIFLTEILFFR